MFKFLGLIKYLLIHEYVHNYSNKYYSILDKI